MYRQMLLPFPLLFLPFPLMLLPLELWKLLLEKQHVVKWGVLPTVLPKLAPVPLLRSVWKGFLNPPVLSPTSFSLDSLVKSKQNNVCSLENIP